MSIYKGYESFIELQIEGLSSDPSASYVSHVRDSNNKELLLELSSAQGDITVPEEGILRFRFSGQSTESFPKHITFDVVRVDITPRRHLGFSVLAEVLNPVTRGLV